MLLCAVLKKSIYLDYNATSPVHPEIKNHLPEWAGVWGNPSSIHGHGREAKRILREARQAFADLIGANPLELIFTSGGSEANNTVIKGLLESEAAKTRKQIISTRVEHPSVLRTLEYAQAHGFEIKYVDINRDGALDIEQYKNLLSDQVLLVTIMAANNETGNIFPISKMTELAKKYGALFHSDAVQTMGRMAFNVNTTGVDFASFSGHKFYALKGVGVLYSRRGQNLPGLILGGGQERGRRAGTENLLAIASLGYMAKKLAVCDLHRESMIRLRDHFEARVVGEIAGVKIIGKEGKRLPNTTCLVISGVSGESLLMSLDVRGYSVSTGAACSSGNPEPSHVLLAMGLTEDEAQTSLRVSIGWLTTTEDVDSFVAAMIPIVDHLRNLSQRHEMEAAVEA
jgi:cysteine desulfurase